jgi:hypothetical protein
VSDSRFVLLTKKYAFNVCVAPSAQYLYRIFILTRDVGVSKFMDTAYVEKIERIQYGESPVAGTALLMYIASQQIGYLVREVFLRVAAKFLSSEHRNIRTNQNGIIGSSLVSGWGFNAHES